MAGHTGARLGCWSKVRNSSATLDQDAPIIARRNMHHDFLIIFKPQAADRIGQGRVDCKRNINVPEQARSFPVPKVVTGQDKGIGRRGCPVGTLQHAPPWIVRSLRMSPPVAPDLISVGRIAGVEGYSYRLP